jgi:hypothetical protein
MLVAMVPITPERPETGADDEETWPIGSDRDHPSATPRSDPLRRKPRVMVYTFILCWSSSDSLHVVADGGREGS